MVQVKKKKKKKQCVVRPHEGQNIHQGVQRAGETLQRRSCPGKETDLRHIFKDGIEFGE